MFTMFTMFTKFLRVSQNSRFITDLTCVENFSCIFRKIFADEISKNQREIIFIIAGLFSSSRSSWLSPQNSGRLNFCDRIGNSFATCILLTLRFSIFRILIWLHRYFLFFFFNKNITSHSPFFTWLLSIFLSLSTNFLKFIIKRLNESTISWRKFLSSISKVFNSNNLLKR